MARQKNNATTIYTAGIEGQILNFACAMVRCVRIDGAEDKAPSGWAVRALLNDGVIGYLHSDLEAEGFYRIGAAMRRDRYGVPTFVTARTDATGAAPFSVNVGKERGELTLLRANVTSTAPMGIIRRYAEMIARAEFHVNVNLLASLRSQIVGVPASQKAAFECLLENAMNGLPTAITPELLETMNTFDISVPLDAPQVNALAMQLWADALKQFGGIAPAAYKAERTQSAEVSAGIAQSIDNVYILIDQFNADAERGGVPYRMEYAGYGSVYDEDTGETRAIENAESEVTGDDGQN